MLPTQVHTFPPLLEGTLIRRYKRFMADIELASGEIVTAHCPNTGSMSGVCHVGGRVMVSKSDNPKRKLAYTWELSEVHDNEPIWVGVNTALPNRVIQTALHQRVFEQLEPYDTIKREVPYGTKSRIDFLLTTDERPIYVEVKNSTWAQKRLCLFPDSVTTRGQKHLRELTALLPDARAVMLYFINRGDCHQFAPGDSADPEYGQLLRAAIAAGVEVLPCRFEISPTGINYIGLAELLV
ncbi:sugar fermentation stimulation protein [Leptolyngbya sp. Heron Island J]|uniref:DNA/RNA nuclease SfsA n=1 Tax=Leptolyngbya sp. Heron Island J TaxID=1385935 RepID=UPI0003B9DB53|nr:DNA/RNA nuclease SfsA [Leptolyngbya sp. Heron Island J]ESA35264.1 sugar fermentation stimulation protein [Leptolyngbya sp. Heron Island J]